MLLSQISVDSVLWGLPKTRSDMQYCSKVTLWPLEVALIDGVIHVYSMQKIDFLFGYYLIRTIIAHYVIV